VNGELMAAEMAAQPEVLARVTGRGGAPAAAGGARGAPPPAGGGWGGPPPRPRGGRGPRTSGPD